MNGGRGGRSRGGHRGGGRSGGRRDDNKRNPPPQGPSQEQGVSGKRSKVRNNARTPNSAVALTEEFMMFVATQFKALKDDPSIPHLTFPTTLDSTQRAYIHKTAIKLGFHSKSTGSSDNRYIFVTRSKTTGAMQAISLRAPPTRLDISKTTLDWMESFLDAFPTAPPAKALAPPPVSGRSHHQTFPKEFPVRPSTGHVYGTEQQSLPVYGHRDELLALSREHQVVIVAGDTGCGKSTQIPQYLLDDGASRVVVTQPRRISAITLAQRIADERHVALGTDVGYAIRLDARYNASTTRLLLCTTGMLLKWLSSDPTGDAFTHIVLDEVHERDKNTDFLLILLRFLLPRRPDLRVILMSATIQVEKFASYFDSSPVVQVQGRMFPVLSCFLDDVLVLLSDKQVAVTTIETSNYTCVMCNQRGYSSEEELGMHVATCFGTEWHANDDQNSFGLDASLANNSGVEPEVFEGSVCDHVHQVLATKRKAFKPNEVASMVYHYQLGQDSLEIDGGVDIQLVVQLLTHLLSTQYGAGAILVFLPGWDDIAAVADFLAMDRRLMAGITLTMLHSQLTPQEQKRAFARPARGTRKVILATNVAETSVTIDDVVYVIDTGKAKQSSLVNGYTALHTEWISQANCAQRKGRAGRVAPGVCFHLVSKKRYEDLAPFMTPELLAISLDEIVLNIELLRYHARDDAFAFDSIAGFLEQAPDPPTSHAIDTAIQSLQLMGALDDEQELTYLGWKLAQLAVPPAIGKMILLGHFCQVYECLLYSCCTLTVRDPFISDMRMSPAQKAERKQAKRYLGRTTSSDHLVVYAAVQSYLNAKRSSRAGEFCRQYWLLPAAMDHIHRVVDQISSEFSSLGYPPLKKEASSTNMAVAHAVLGAGLYPNLMYRTTANNGKNFTTKEKFKVKVSASSVLDYPPNRQEKTEWVAFHDMRQSERSRNAQVTTKIAPFILAVFVGHNAALEEIEETDDEAAEGQELLGEGGAMSRVRIVIDGWIVLETDRLAAELVLAIRERFDYAFIRHLHQKKHQTTNDHDMQLLRALQSWCSREISL
ncbi:hypothetical protein AeMF1_005002 [Aphanomyces euteiches]|nr:hypothetical protein AeMF1_005002 [Aphanomyces euteiches]KAH9190439.1 hypothetical protein AeNC1_007586 [Aphanomyces euteiches]